jgi:very-short-patch-repair endonuclease
MIYQELDHVATRQYGLVTNGQLRKLGLSQRQVDWRVARGVLIRVRYLVYRVAGSPVRWEQSVLSAILGAKANAVISHQTAAALWNLRHSDRGSAGIHVTAGTRVRMEGVTCHVAPITPEECTTHAGIPVTTGERTIMDLSDVLEPQQLAECVDDALRRGLIQLERLRALVTHADEAAEAAKTRGVRRRLAPIHQILADRIVGYRPDESEFEKRMNAEWDRLCLPPAQRQYRVRCGQNTYRIDVALPDTRIGVEWESLAHHGTRSGIDNDSNRRADLTAEGWVILSFTWNSSPERIANAVLRLWRDRGGQAAATTDGPRQVAPVR